MAVVVTSIQPQAEISAGWPERLGRAASAHASATDPTARSAALGELWVLMGAALLRYVRAHARPYGHLAEDDLRDIAADKALALYHQIEAGSWRPAELAAPQLCAFLSRVAHNGLVDHFRTLDRERRHGLRPGPADQAPPEPTSPAPHSVTATPEERLQGAQFAAALRDCAASLRPRARRAWFLRVFYDWGSREIAAHPGVAMTAGAVDVALKRARDTMTECMRKKGLEPGDMPTGTFVLLWDEYRSSFDYEDGTP